MDDSTSKPMPSKPDDKEKYMDEAYESLAQDYDKFQDNLSSNRTQQQKYQLIEIIQPKPGISFLDMAGGTGEATLGYIKYQDTVNKDSTSTVVVFDLNQRMLDVARKRLEPTGWLDSGRARIVQGNAMDLSMFDDNSFDVYCSLYGFHNMPDHDTALKEAFRVLKPGGQLVIAELNTGNGYVAKKLIRVLVKMIAFLFGDRGIGNAAMTRRLIESSLEFPSPLAFVETMKCAGFKTEGRGYKPYRGGLHAAFFGVKP